MNDGTVEQKSEPRYFVESLARGLTVLDAFDPAHRELSLAELASISDVGTATAFRIAHTLVQLGYLTRDPETKAYQLGPTVLSLGMSSLSSMTLPDVVDPYLQALRDDIDENVKCAVVQGTDVVYVAHYRSRSHPSRVVYTGTRTPAHTTSSGRAFYANLPDDVAEELVERSPRPRFTSRSLTATNAIMAEVRRARELGYAVNDQGRSMEHRSVAAALVNYRGYPVGAINIAVWAGRTSRSEMEERYGPRVVATAAEISALIPAQLEGFLESGELIDPLSEE